MVIALGDDQLFTLLFLIQKALYDVPNVGPFNTYLGTNTNSVTRFGEFSPLWQDLHVFGKFLTAHSLFGKMLSLLWQICDIIGLVFILANGQ